MKRRSCVEGAEGDGGFDKTSTGRAAASHAAHEPCFSWPEAVLVL